MTDINFTDEDLGLFLRLLHFADQSQPIEDALGNRIYPTEDTRAHAKRLQNQFNEAGVELPKGLYSMFDPFSLQGVEITARSVELSEGAEITVKDIVEQVSQDERTEEWYVRFKHSNLTFTYPSRESLKRNHHRESIL